MESLERKSKRKIKREKEKRGFAFISWICKRCFRTADNGLVLDAVLLLEAAADADEDAESVCLSVVSFQLGFTGEDLLRC